MYREAFVKSIDREALFQQIYAPLVEGGELLQCGPIVPGDYCTDAWADVTYDQAGAEQILTDAGWTKNGDGFWADPDGNVPNVRWMVNTGNTRRESTQAYLIPLLAQAGFKVTPDNCEALPCVFQQRLPALDYDMGMYISTAPPDPSYLINSFTCAQIPTEANGNQGQNQQGVCDEEASALLEQSERDGRRGGARHADHRCARAALGRQLHAPVAAVPEVGLLPHRQGGRAGRRRR